MPWMDDPCSVPGTGWTPDEVLAHSDALAGTIGQEYMEKRGVSLEVADAGGVRFCRDFGGRSAVVVGLRNREQMLVSAHGRYLSLVRRENKMLTVGVGGGVVSMLDGWRTEPIILVEGLFDALSLAQCGVASVATIGRWAPWLSDVCSHRSVWLAFDANRPGEAEVARYRQRLSRARLRRLIPPPHSKDWNTALMKKGAPHVSRWIRNCMDESKES
jgi:hypothetical protein